MKSVQKEQAVFKVVQGPYEVKEVIELPNDYLKTKALKACAKERIIQTTKILPGRWALLQFVKGKLRQVGNDTYKDKKDADKLFLTVAPVGAVLR